MQPTEPGAEAINANALDLPLPDESVDLIVTSPPYFALRSYRDGDEHYGGQVGSEPTPQEFLEALWAATREMVRVLKPSGSIWVNLGDKYAGSGGHNNSGLAMRDKYDQRSRPGVTNKAQMKRIESDAQGLRRDAPRSYNKESNGIRHKSLMGLPWRYAIGCIDQLGLILRAEVIWSKPNGLPESVTDRVRRSHEQWFHFTKQGRYFSAVDELREVYVGDRALSRRIKHNGDGKHEQRAAWAEEHPLGRLPGSVWTVPSEPLIIPDAVKAHYDLPDHFAAFPQEWPRRIILGWSPSGVCVKCGEGRRPVVEKGEYRSTEPGGTPRHQWGTDGRQRPKPHGDGTPTSTLGFQRDAAITGYACACTPCESCHANVLESTYDKSVHGVRAADRQGSFEGEVGDGTALQDGQGEVLRSDLCQPLELSESDEHEIPASDNAGLRGGVEAGASDGAEERLRDGASTGDGRAPRPDAGARGSGASPQRGEDGQPDREPRTDGEDRARSEAEAPAQAVRVPSLRRDDPVVRQSQPCPHCNPAPTRPSVVLDPFGGTGTTSMVARALGRYGISVDLSADYCRLAEWRIFQSGHADNLVRKAIESGAMDASQVPPETLERARPKNAPQPTSLFDA